MVVVYTNDLEPSGKDWAPLFYIRNYIILEIFTYFYIILEVFTPTTIENIRKQGALVD